MVFVIFKSLYALKSFNFTLQDPETFLPDSPVRNFIYTKATTDDSFIPILYGSLVDNSNLLTEQINLYKYEILLLLL